MTIERFYQEYLTSGGDEQFRFVTLGEWTVDLKKYLLMLTDEPDNPDHYRIVLRANTHKRQRLDNSRFSSPITVDLPERELWEEENEENYATLWLGW